MPRVLTDAQMQELEASENAGKKRVLTDAEMKALEGAQSKSIPMFGTGSNNPQATSSEYVQQDLRKRLEEAKRKLQDIDLNEPGNPAYRAERVNLAREVSELENYFNNNGGFLSGVKQGALNSGIASTVGLGAGTTDEAGRQAVMKLGAMNDQNYQGDTAYNVGNFIGTAVPDAAGYTVAGLTAGVPGVAAYGAATNLGREISDEQKRVVLEQGKNTSDANLLKAAAYSVPQTAVDVLTAGRGDLIKNAAKQGIAKTVGKEAVNLGFDTGLNTAADAGVKAAAGESGYDLDTVMKSAGTNLLAGAGIRYGIKGNSYIADKVVDNSAGKFVEKTNYEKAAADFQDVANSAGIDIKSDPVAGKAVIDTMVEADPKNPYLQKIKDKFGKHVASFGKDVQMSKIDAETQARIENSNALRLMRSRSVAGNMTDFDGNILNKPPKDVNPHTFGHTLASSLQFIDQHKNGVSGYKHDTLASKVAAFESMGWTPKEIKAELKKGMRSRQESGVVFKDNDFRARVEQYKTLMSETGRDINLSKIGRGTVKAVKASNEVNQPSIRNIAQSIYEGLVDDENSGVKRLVRPEFRAKLGKGETTFAEKMYMLTRTQGAVQWKSDRDVKKAVSRFQKETGGKFSDKEVKDIAGLYVQAHRYSERGRRIKKNISDAEVRLAQHIAENEAIGARPHAEVQDKANQLALQIKNEQDFIKARQDEYANTKMGDLTIDQMDRLARSMESGNISEMKKIMADVKGDTYGKLLKGMTDPDILAAASKVGKELFDINRGKLKELYESGKLTESEYNNLLEYDYARQESGKNAWDTVKSLNQHQKRDVLNKGDLQNVEGSRQFVDLDIERQLSKSIQHVNKMIRQQEIENMMAKSADAGEGIFKKVTSKDEQEPDMARRQITQDGKKITIEYHKDIDKLFTKEDYRDLMRFMSVFSGTTVLKKFATVTNLDFAAANIFRDIAYHAFRDSAGIFAPRIGKTKVNSMAISVAMFMKEIALVAGNLTLQKLRKIKDTNKIIAKLTKQKTSTEVELDKYRTILDDARDAGATHGTSLDNYDRIAFDMGDAQRLATTPGYGIQNTAKKSINKMKDAIDGLGEIVNLSEEITRAAVYNRAKKAGMSDLEAAYYTASSIDFTRSGKYGRILNSFTPYFNAAVQGMDGYVRSFKENPTLAAIKTMEIVAAAAGVTMLRTQLDPEAEPGYDNTSLYTKIVLPLFAGETYYKGDKKERAGGGIPLSQEMFLPWAIGTIMGHIAMKQQGYKTPDIGGSDILSALYKMSPFPTLANGAPTANAALALFANFDTFRLEKVYRGVEGGINQVDPYTNKTLADFTKWIYEATGGAVNLPPKNIQVGLGKLFAESNTIVKGVNLASSLYQAAANDDKESEHQLEGLNLLKKLPIFGKFVVPTNFYGRAIQEDYTRQEIKARAKYLAESKGGLSDKDKKNYRESKIRQTEYERELRRRD